MPLIESATWDAVETAEHVRQRDVSVREVIDAAIERAEAASALGAVVTATFDAAREGRPTGALAGVPTFVKDLAQVAQVPTTWGSSAAGSFVSKRTDPSLARFFATGLVSLGKSATPELGLTATTEPIGKTPCRNPWDPTRSTGGSSGGAGCLVAAGVVPIAHASDGGGSIRIPAACCGLVGLKPTRKRFDMDGSSLLPVNIAVQGVLSRTVRDTVAFWSALEAAEPTIDKIGSVRPEPGRALRIGVFTGAPTRGPVDREHRVAAEDAGKLCEELGHRADAIECPFEPGVIEDFLRYWGLIAFVQARFGKLLVHRDFDASRLEPWTKGMGRYFTSQLRAGVSAIARLRRFGPVYAKAIERYDVLVCPTTAEPPPLLGYLRTDQDFETKFERLVRFTPFTPIANVAGAPAISLPLGRTRSGLPIGVHFAARVGDDRTLLELASTLEAAKPWPRIAPADAWRSLAP